MNGYTSCHAKHHTYLPEPQHVAVGIADRVRVALDGQDEARELRGRRGDARRAEEARCQLICESRWIGHHTRLA